MIGKIKGVALLATLWGSLMVAAPQASEESGIVQSADETDAVVAEHEAEVDLGLLEFLGQWETDSGEWISPEDLVDANFVELLPTTETTEIEAID